MVTLLSGACCSSGFDDVEFVVLSLGPNLMVFCILVVWIFGYGYFFWQIDLVSFLYDIQVSIVGFRCCIVFCPFLS